MEIIPHLFTCPISLELFRDPVTICTGQTYDRPCIEKWIGSGNDTCPVTMQKLHDLSMVPNHTLRHLIDQWLQMVPHQFNNDLDHDHCFSKVGCCCFNVSIPSLKHTLESKDTTFEQKVEALEQVRCLLDDLPMRNDGLLIQLGFFSLLLRLVFGSQKIMMVVVEIALECVVKLVPYCELSHLNMIINESNFETFKVLLKEGTSMVKICLYNLIQLIFISSSLEIEELVTKLGNEKKVLKELITSLCDSYDQQNHELVEAAMKAILGLLTSSSSQECHENLVEEGLVNTLVTYILKVLEKQGKNNLAPKAIRVVEMILQVQGGKESFLVNGVIQNGVKALVKMVFRVSSRDEEGSESAINSLMILCYESKQVREEAISVGILTQLLLLLQSQCSGRTKTRARMLLKLLRSMCFKDPKHV